MIPWVKYNGARPEKASFANASRINLWSDSTTAYTLPILIPYMGPYCLVNAVNDKCGCLRLRKGKYPTIGRPHGPGGKLCPSLCFLNIQKPRTKVTSHKKKKSILIWNKRNWRLISERNMMRKNVWFFTAGLLGKLSVNVTNATECVCYRQNV